VNVLRLKAKIIEKGMNVEGLAKSIGIDRSSLYRKLNNFEKFTIGEANQIKEILEMTNEEASNIFFA
jgi:predicted transcriptional regulator